MRAIAPLPVFLPGEYAYFIKDDDGYLLVLDDDDHTSYRLGSDVHKIATVLANYRADNLLIDAIDGAREYGTAMAVFKDRRIVRDPFRSNKPEKLDFTEFDEQTDGKKTTYLPPLVV